MPYPTSEAVSLLRINSVVEAKKGKLTSIIIEQNNNTTTF